MHSQRALFAWPQLLALVRCAASPEKAVLAFARAFASASVVASVVLEAVFLAADPLSVAVVAAAAAAVDDAAGRVSAVACTY